MIHGKKKTDQKKGQAEIKSENELGEKINEKMNEFFAIRKQEISEQKIPTLMEFTAILMQLCPGLPTIFNYRRELMEKLFETQDPAARAKSLASQIKLITKIMQEDNKLYNIWCYRQWLVTTLFKIDPIIITKQKQICSMLLMKDEKNFHVWNYRNWANTIQMNVDVELEFTKSKINSNPFNFSPYHFRSKYLIWKYTQEFQKLDNVKKQEVVTFGMPKEVFNAEMETVRTAIFLNPKEEAPWLYYSWLLKQILPSLLLQIQPNSQIPSDSYQLIFSLPLKTLQPAVHIPQNNPLGLTLSTPSSTTCKITFKQPTDKKMIQIKQNLNEILIQNQSSGRRLIWDRLESVAEVRGIYEAQEKFLLEVNQSEENDCRFGWIQILDLYRSMLYLGVDVNDWETITSKSLAVFEHLANPEKGQQYILKQQQYWQRLHEGKNLTVIEQKLKNFRNK